MWREPRDTKKAVRNACGNVSIDEGLVRRLEISIQRGVEGNFTHHGMSCVSHLANYSPSLEACTGEAGGVGG